MHMRKLENMREQAVDGVKAAAASGKTSEMIQAVSRVREIDALIKQAQSLEDAVRALEDPASTSKPLWLDPTEIRGPSPRAGARGEDHLMEESTQRDGKRRAAAARQDLQAILRERLGEYTRVKQTIVRTKGGRTIAMAFAAYARRDRNRWFLGIPEEPACQVAILMCQAKGGVLNRFVLPEEFLGQHRRHLSKANRQLKFNIVHKDGEFNLLVPPKRKVPIQGYLERFDLLS